MTQETRLYAIQADEGRHDMVLAELRRAGFVAKPADKAKMFNLNDRFRFRPTQLGLDVYRDYYLDMANGMPPAARKRFLQCDPCRLEVDGNDVASLQAWQFMAIFGAHMGNGFPLVCDTGIFVERSE